MLFAHFEGQSTQLQEELEKGTGGSEQDTTVAFIGLCKPFESLPKLNLIPNGAVTGFPT